jgi:hypothetical protein
MTQIQVLAEVPAGGANRELLGWLPPVQDAIRKQEAAGFRARIAKRW